MIRRLAAVLALAAIACAGAATDRAGAPATSARIGLVEWEITTSAAVLSQGEVFLRVTNAGTTTHDLRVSGAGTQAATPLLAPGESAILSLQVDKSDELILWCGLPGHRRQGMERRLLAAEAS